MKDVHPLENPESVEAILSRVSFLGGLDHQQRAGLYPYFEAAEFDKGEVIARHGETPTHIYIIEEGSVSLVIEDEDTSVAKRTFHSGDCFGEAAMLSLINNTASFVSEEKSRLIVFSRKSFNKLRKEDPETFCQLILNLARELARKLQYSDEILLHPEDRIEPQSRSHK